MGIDRASRTLSIRLASLLTKISSEENRVKAPKFDDTEVTSPELQARIQKTLDYLASVPPAALDGTEQKEITFPVRILRHNGVDVGKGDFLLGPNA